MTAKSDAPVESRSEKRDVPSEPCRSPIADHAGNPDNFRVAGTLEKQRQDSFRPESCGLPVATNTPDAVNFLATAKTDGSAGGINRNSTVGQTFDAIMAQKDAGHDSMQLDGKKYSIEMSPAGKGGQQYVHLFDEKGIAYRAIYNPGQGGNESTRSQRGGFFQEEQAPNGNAVGFTGERFRENKANADLPQFDKNSDAPGGNLRPNGDKLPGQKPTTDQLPPVPAARPSGADILPGPPPARSHDVTAPASDALQPIAEIKDGWDPAKGGVPSMADLTRERFRGNAPVTGAIDRAQASGKDFDSTFLKELKSVDGGRYKDEAKTVLKEEHAHRQDIKITYARDMLAANAFAKGTAPAEGQRLDALVNGSPSDRALASEVAGMARQLGSMPDTEMKAELDRASSATGRATRGIDEAADPKGADAARRAALHKELAPVPSNLTWYQPRSAEGGEFGGSPPPGENKVPLKQHTLQAFLHDPVATGFIAAASDSRHPYGQYGTMFSIAEMHDPKYFEAHGTTRDKFFQENSGKTYDQWMQTWSDKYAQKYNGAKLDGPIFRVVDRFGAGHGPDRYDLSTDVGTAHNHDIEQFNSKNFRNQQLFTTHVLDMRIDGEDANRSGNPNWGGGTTVRPHRRR